MFPRTDAGYARAVALVDSYELEGVYLSVTTSVDAYMVVLPSAPSGPVVKRQTVRPPFKVNVWSDPEYWNPVHVNGRVIGYVGTRAYNVWSARMADGAHVWQDNGADSTRAAMVAAILAQYIESN